MLQSEIDISSCDLCPRVCGVDRSAGARGVCGADGRLRIARAALHFWEEPPISGTHGSGTVFFSWCPLNINLVTPTHYAPHARAALDLARERGMDLPVVWNTSGYETVRAVRENRGYADVYLTDYKYASSDLAARYSKAPNYPQVALDALSAMVDEIGDPCFDEYEGDERMTRGVVVRHLMLPGALEDSKRVVQTVWEHFGSSVLLSIMNQYTPVLAESAKAGDAWACRELERCSELARRVPNEDYERLLDFADSLGIEDYFWQEGGAAEESFIPAFDLEGVLSE